MTRSHSAALVWNPALDDAAEFPSTQALANLPALRFGLPSPAPVLAIVYAADGTCVREIVRGELPSGEHVIRWDGLDAVGLRAPKGTYRLRLDVGAFTHIERPIVLG